METNAYTEEEFRIDDYLDEKARKKKLKEEKKKRKSYKFSNKKHSKNGILSSVLALFAVIVLIAAIIISTIYKGNAGILTGTLAALGFLAAIVGFILSAASFREVDKLYRFSWIGIIANGILFILFGIIIIGGL